MSSSAALEEMHHIPLEVKAGRARIAVIMLILSDALSIVALLAAGGYLSTLNTFGQFQAGDHGPAFLPGLLAVIAVVLSGLSYYLWERSTKSNDGVGTSAFFILALVLLLASLGCQIWLGVTLGYQAPFHAYASLILLLTWYSAFHLALTAIIGLLLLGRITRGRLSGKGYIIEVTGYWWYYTAIAGLLMWLFSVII